MKKLSFFRKIELFDLYSKIINENSLELSTKYNIRIDKANRLYTVINLPEADFEEAYSIRKADIDSISERYIRAYSKELSTFLDSKGLKELYSYYEITKVAKFSYKIVFGFSLFRSNKFFDNLYYRVIPITVLAAISLLLIIFL